MVTERIQRAAFDSRLITSTIGPSRNAELILSIRVFLERCDPLPELIAHTAGGIPLGPVRFDRRPGTNVAGDGMGDFASTVRWDDAEWASWGDSLAGSVQEAINGPGNRGRFWMVPRAYWGVGWPPGEAWGYLPNVKCLFHMARVQEAARAQRVIRCYRLAGPSDLRSSMERGGQGGMLTNRDVASQRMQGGTSQVIAVHEFFHALGMQHVNYPYARDTIVGSLRSLFHLESVAPNDASEYGVTPGQRANIMGGGSALEGWNFWPWLNRLQKHLDPQFRVPQVEWSVVDNRPWPRSRAGVVDLPLNRR